MGYEIDVLGVGEKSNSGDAIAVRYGNLFGKRHEQTVVVIDGGYKDNGDALVNHIRTHYGTEKIDLVISTHPDQDHINGLAVVLEELEAVELWIHKAWEHNEGLADKFKDGRITDNSIGERLKANMESAYQLVAQAESKGVIVNEPFTGLSAGEVTVLGPTIEFYEELLPQFEGMPATKREESSVENLTGLSALFEGIEKAIRTFFATWGDDLVDDEDTTSAKNNSSVLTQILVDGKRLVFTGDAGIKALDGAADEINLCQSGAELRFIQIPHHGSKRNVGPSVLNRLIGEVVERGETRNITAIASTAKEGEPKHPHKAVMNAFTHRGVTALATRGSGVRSHHNAPVRQGWVTLKPEPYHDDWEEV